MLTADAFGVMPPTAKPTPAQAMYHFLSGYTAKVAGTEKGVTDPEATFSTCFGAPFMPRHPSEYGNLLRELIAAHAVDCWLVNTGWTGGKYGTGRRMPIKVTRTLLSAALDGSLRSASFRTDPYFGFSVPTSVRGVEPHLLYPFKTWRDKADFDHTARKLVAMFRDNFVRFESQVDADVRAARAAALAGHGVVVVEAAAAIGSGLSSRNSEVVHAGMYYPTGSVRALHCVRGNRLLYEFCAAHAVAHRKCGKLIVATTEPE